MVTRGHVHRLDEASALIARQNDRRAGAAAFLPDVTTASTELLSLNAMLPGQGVGSALLAAVEDQARSQGSQRVWLATGNDNLDGLRFYQRRGYRLVAVHAGAIDAARRLKPAIPEIGSHGIPLHDEIELEKRLG